ATGTIGFGWSEVSGQRRVPLPPAMITAFNSFQLPCRDRREALRVLLAVAGAIGQSGSPGKGGARLFRPERPRGPPVGVSAGDRKIDAERSLGYPIPAVTLGDHLSRLAGEGRAPGL